MDYEKIIESTGSKEFWDKFSELKTNLISALEKAETAEKQCNLPTELEQCTIPDVIVSCSSCKWSRDGNKSIHTKICQLCVNFSEHAL